MMFLSSKSIFEKIKLCKNAPWENFEKNYFFEKHYEIFIRGLLQLRWKLQKFEFKRKFLLTSFWKKIITSDCKVPPKIDVTSDCVDAFALAVLLNLLKKKW